MFTELLQGQNFEIFENLLMTLGDKTYCWHYLWDI